MKNITFESLFSFDISPYAHRKTFKAGEHILKEGETIDSLIFMEEGRTKCCMSHENG